MRRFNLLFLMIIIVGTMLASMARADTLGVVITSIRNRGVYFDSERFPDTVLRDFANDAQMLIATIGKTKQSDTSIALVGTGFSYALPSDFYLAWAAIINANPDLDLDDNNRPYYLDYVPSEKYGWSAPTGEGRPTAFTVWSDSLFTDVVSASEIDTIALKYFALPTAMTGVGSDIDLPAAYIPLLKDAVQYMCVNRIVFPGRTDKQETLQLAGFLTQAILGRKQDEP